MLLIGPSVVSCAQSEWCLLQLDATTLGFNASAPFEWAIVR